MKALSFIPGTPVEPVVYVVDDDKRMRESLLDLLAAAHRQASAFASGSEFLRTADTSKPGCIVIDLQMPDGSGLEMQDKLLTLGCPMPLIFLTGHADVHSSVTALKAGASDFILKPFAAENLLEAVDKAIRQDGDRRQMMEERDRVRALADLLTLRERDVTLLVASGLMNKQVAYELGISEMTVKLHRMHAMRKMECRSLPDLVRKVEKLQAI